MPIKLREREHFFYDLLCKQSLLVPFSYPVSDRRILDIDQNLRCVTLFCLYCIRNFRAHQLKNKYTLYSLIIHQSINLNCSQYSFSSINICYFAYLIFFTQTHYNSNIYMQISPFHLAIPVNSIAKSIAFYGKILGCQEGRKCKKGSWIDYNFFGHQLVCHFVGQSFKPIDYFNPVDGDQVPVPHFGLCLNVDQWHSVKSSLLEAKVKFMLQPHLRFSGFPGEQYTMFLKDPSGNNLQFKAMTNPKNLFARYEVE